MNALIRVTSIAALTAFALPALAAPKIDAASKTFKRYPGSQIFRPNAAQLGKASASLGGTAFAQMVCDACSGTEISPELVMATLHRESLFGKLLSSGMLQNGVLTAQGRAFLAKFGSLHKLGDPSGGLYRAGSIVQADFGSFPELETQALNGRPIWEDDATMMKWMVNYHLASLAQSRAAGFEPHDAILGIEYNSGRVRAKQRVMAGTTLPVLDGITTKLYGTDIDNMVSTMHAAARGNSPCCCATCQAAGTAVVVATAPAQPTAPATVVQVPATAPVAPPAPQTVATATPVHAPVSPSDLANAQPSDDPNDPHHDPIALHDPIGVQAHQSPMGLGEALKSLFGLSSSN